MGSEQKDYARSFINKSIISLHSFANSSECIDLMCDIARSISKTMSGGGKLLIAGNGESAGDAQHIAGEFLSRLMFDRAALPAIALTVDSSVLTAIGNDYGFERIFERQIVGLGRPGDVFIGISTSGASSNILRALAEARALGLTTVGFTGSRGKKMQGLCDFLLEAPASETAVIQQIHIVAAHVICALVERSLFSDGSGAALA